MKPLSTPDIISKLHDDDSNVDLREYINVLSRYKWAILALTCIVTTISALYVYSLEPVYRATTSILLDVHEENVVSIEDVYRLQGGAMFYLYNTQLELIQSRDLAERVIKRLDLGKYPEFKMVGAPAADQPVAQPVNESWKHKLKNWLVGLLPDNWAPKSPHILPVEQREQNSVLGRFASMLSVTIVPDTLLIKISFDSRDPQLAATLANELAEVYILSAVEDQIKVTQNASTWITKEMEELKKKVVESEQALQAYRDKEQLIDAKGVDSIAVMELDEISSRLAAARAKRTEAQEQYRQVTALEGQPIEAYESISAVLKDSLVQQAKARQAEANRKISELSERYGPKHPKMIAAQAELATANDNLHTQIRHVIESVKKAYSVAQAEESHLISALNNAKSDIVDINRKGYTLKTLEQEVETNRHLYDMFLTRFKETSATNDLHKPFAHIVDKAVPPSSPYKPDKQKFIFISFLLSLFISVLLVFLLEKLDNTLKDSTDVENKLYLPVLGILPKLNIWMNKDIKAMRYFSDKKHSSFSENIRTIRTSVLLNDIDTSKKIILVTSSVPEEGKSIVAVNLALALGQIKKTLLIDTDMRKPSIDRVFGMKKNEPGLTHYIAGTHEMKNCIHYFEKEKLHVMPAGQTPSNPLELLSSSRFEKMATGLLQYYDYVVFDSAPTIPVSDAVVLSRIADITIYVVKADATPYQLAQAGVRKLNNIDAKVLGAVLNQVIPSKRPGRYGYGESDYYTYYGYHQS